VPALQSLATCLKDIDEIHEGYVGTNAKRRIERHGREGTFIIGIDDNQLFG
jgi:hypothetical protein